MKKILCALSICLAATTVSFAQTPAAGQEKPAAAKDNKNAPHFKFKGGDSFDFGTIKESPTGAEHVFEFTNTGKEPLIIQNAVGSCGCTTPDWPKEPILPGKTGKIKVHYASQGRVGPIQKSVFITSNAAPGADGQPRYELKITGTVVAATPAPAAGTAEKK
jgi:hypothetical protein